MSRFLFLLMLMFYQLHHLLSILLLTFPRKMFFVKLTYLIGPLGKVMSMIPGLSQIMQAQGKV